MNNKYFILIVFNFIFSQVFTDISFVGSRSIGTAGTIVSNPKSSECVFYNPAGLVKSEQISFLIGHNDLYNLSFMNHNYLSIVLPSKKYFGSLSSGFSLSYQNLQTSYGKNSSTFGSFTKDLSRETAVTLSHGIDLLNDRHSSLSFGYNLNYMLFYQAPSAGYDGGGVNGLASGESSTFSLDVGIHSSLRNKISFGAFIKNITSSRIGKGSSLTFLPRRLNVGVGYTPYPDLSTHFALDRNMEEKRSSFRFGFEYLVNKNFEIKSGIQMSENNNRFGLGFSIYLEYLDISYSVMTHPILDNINTLEIKVATFE